MNKSTYHERLEQIRDEKRKYDTWFTVESQYSTGDKIYKDIEKWLINNTNSNYIVRYQPGKVELRFLFEKENDAILFALRWS